MRSFKWSHKENEKKNTTTENKVWLSRKWTKKANWENPRLTNTPAQWQRTKRSIKKVARISSKLRNNIYLRTFGWLSYQSTAFRCSSWRSESLAEATTIDDRRKRSAKNNNQHIKNNKRQSIYTIAYRMNIALKRTHMPTTTKEIYPFNSVLSYFRWGRFSYHYLFNVFSFFVSRRPLNIS